MKGPDPGLWAVDKQHLFPAAQECRETAEQAVSYFTATSDLWSNHASDPYISFTVHFVGVYCTGIAF